MTLGLVYTRLGEYLLSAQLSALQDQGKLHILSSPSITTLDNQNAYIESGQDVPYQSVEDGEVKVEYKKAVLRLDVTPHVIDGETLKMIIKVNKDQPDFSRTVLGNPTIITKKAEANVIQNDGQTIVIGGLSKESSARNKTGTPFLEDTPGLGYLFIAFIVLLTGVIPRFVGIFKSAGLTLPLPTQICMLMYDFLVGHWYLALSIFVVGAVGSYFYIRSAPGKVVFSKAVMKIPILGPLFIKSAISRFASIFSILQASGIYILQTMDILSDTIGNAAIANELDGKFYRLNVFILHLPPLRERKEDIPLLVDFFLQGVANKMDISPVALQMLIAFAWPGNIRELKNTIESAAVLAENGYIEPAQLSSKITAAFNNSSQTGLNKPVNIPLDERLREIEKTMIIEALRKTGGVQVRATELLGINQRSLWHRVKKHNIDVKDIKSNEI